MTTSSPKIVQKKLFSPIWLLPLIALGLALWLAVKSWQQQGAEIQIYFPSASGIDIGKTLIRYQGLNVGKVTNIRLNEINHGVDVTVLIEHQAKHLLKQGTEFWLVAPKASITGVEGLDALFSGNYIAMQPGTGSKKSNFIALDHPPAVLTNEAGLVVELQTAQLGSLNVGSGVFYRQVPVGEIIGYRLDEDAKHIIVSAFIQQQYADLISQETRFWNVSGVEIDASLSGIKVKTESLSTILAGGIAFADAPSSNLTASSEVAKKTTNNSSASYNSPASYILYESQQQAIGGLNFELQADHAETVKTGTPIQFKGIQVGELLQGQLNEQGVLFQARLFDGYQELLTASSQFYPQGAELSLSGIKHPQRLVTGAVIELRPGIGEAKSRYSLLERAPSDHSNVLTMLATTRDAPNLKQGMAIKYKQFTIGEVSQITLQEDFETIAVELHIEQAFKPLITQASFLYGASALDVQASNQGIEVKTAPVMDLLQGTLYLVKGDSQQPHDFSQPLTIYSDRQSAEQVIAARQMQQLTLTSPDAANVAVGTPVFYKKMQVGQVTQLDWRAAEDDFKIQLAIEKKFNRLLKPNTIFWQNSAVQIDAGLTGVDIDVAPLKGMVWGGISLGHLPEQANTQANTKASLQPLYASRKLAFAQATPIQLIFPAEARLAKGADIRYQGHQIGEVQTVTLSDDLKQIELNAWLYGQYAAHFSAIDSQYFLTDAKISLTGVQAPETLITGAYIHAIPGQSTEQRSHFIGHLNAQLYAQTSNEALKLTLYRPSLGSISQGTAIFYRGIQIGQVEGYQLAATGQQVDIFIAIDANYKHLINQSSQFWESSGIAVDIGLFSGAQIETESLQTILAGGISVATKESNRDNNQLLDYQRLPLQQKLPAEADQWQPQLNAL